MACLLLTAASAHAQFGSQPVGVASVSRGVTVTATATGSVSSVEVLTMGAAGLDFTQGQGLSTCEAMAFSAVGQTCTESVVFIPRAQGLRMGAVELFDSAGRPLGTAMLSGNGFGGLGILVPGNEITVAGGGS